MSGSKVWAGFRAVAAAGILGVVSVLPARAENLADALTGAYLTSGLLEQNRALLRAADEDVAVAVSALRPIISWTANVQQSYNRSTLNGQAQNSTSAFVGLNLDWLLFDGGSQRYLIEAAKELVLATRWSLVSVEQDVLLQAVQSYMELRRAAEFVALTQNNVRLITQELRAARDRFEVGEVTRTDVAAAQARLAEAQGNLASRQGELERAREEYLIVTGSLPGAQVPPPPLPPLPVSIDAAQAVAFRLHPDIRDAQHQVAASNLRVLSAEASTLPELRVQGNLGRGENEGRFDPENASVALQLRQPIYQGGRIAAVVRRAIAQRDASQGALLVAQEFIALDVAEAFLRVQVARAQIEATEVQIEAAETAFAGVREEATLGARTTLDVLDAEQELLDARARRISAQADLTIAAYALLAAQGLLTVERLDLPVQTYDPAAYYNMVKDAPAKLSPQGRKLDRVLRALNRE